MLIFFVYVEKFKLLPIFILLIVFLHLLSGCSATTPMTAKFAVAPAIRPFHDNYWLLLNDLKFETVRDQDEKRFEITVPAGFVTDLASIPVPLNVFYNEIGSYASAGILHDYLYWTQQCDRETSDRLIKEALKATGSGYVTRNTIKKGVKIFGWYAWNNNKKSKANGDFRFIPESYRAFPSDENWKKYKGNFVGKKLDIDKFDGSICEIFK